MALAKKLDPSASPRALYGAELRYYRKRAGYTQDELGELLFVSGAFIGLLEAAARRIQPDFAARLDAILKTDGFFVRNIAAGEASPYPEHFADVVDLEATATEIHEFAPVLVPGLLQTEEYARAVFRSANPIHPEASIDEWVYGRLARSRIFDHPTEPVFWAVLDESILHREVAGRSAMASQLRHIADLVRSGRIVAQVLPYQEGAHGAMQGSVKMMAFSDSQPLAYIQSIETGRLLDDPSVVARCQRLYDLARASALSRDASLARIEAAAEAFDGH
ncbi:helix-turn-helix transcriptional regulator [Streptomyces sp. NPDC089919]|uniref:helix-turn-helix domain-containing protein n=1 Tax=Streptomyces sp. NPDC089919 TaxID=3155188 RepID=UPI003446EA7A